MLNLFATNIMKFVLKIHTCQLCRESREKTQYW